jgi:competence protein ComEC
MLLGQKRAMSKEVREWFNKCSTTHITVISGMHVSIVATLLMNLALAFYLSRKQAFWFAVIGITLFVILTGAQASAVRAGIIGGLVLLAIHSGRLSEIKNALLFTASTMLLINPRILKFDVGFQLSFLAVIGIVYLSPYLEKGLKFFPQTFKIRDSASMTLSAQIMTLPLILFHFGRISLIAPIANILILPLVPLTMILGFISGVLGLVWIFLGQITSWLTWLFLTYELLVVKWLSKIPFASIEIKNVWVGLLVIYYLVLFGWIWWIKRKERSLVISYRL